MGRKNPHLSANYVNTLGSVESSCVIHCAAAGANSYRGTGQLWENIEQETSPEADPQSSGPWYLGGSILSAANDPTFTGRAGHKGSYFSFDGADFLTYTGQDGSSPAVVDGCWKNIHKTTGGQAFTFVTTIRYESNGTLQSLLATKASGAFQGINIYIDASHKINFLQRGASAQTLVTSTAALVDGDDFIIGVGADGTDCTFWVGTTTGETVSAAYQTATGAPTSPMVVGVIFDSTITTAGFYLGAGTRMYDLALFNILLDDTKFGNVKTAIEAYNGIDFTP